MDGKPGGLPEMSSTARKFFDFGAIVCFAGLVGVTTWFVVCAVGPKLGLVDGNFALESLTFVWGSVFAALVLVTSLASGALLWAIRHKEREFPHGSGFVLTALVVAACLLAASLASRFEYGSACHGCPFGI